MIRDRRDGLRRASVLILDPTKDIAVLTIDGDFGADDVGFALSEPSPDTPVEVVTFADIEGPEIKTGTIARLVNATLDGEGRRKAIELAAIDIDPGDSGAPVVNEDGDAVAMVFAAARAEERAWAISAVELRDAVAHAFDPTTEPSGLSCARNRSADADGG
jgi:S1-C subfamily serine protease